MDIQPYKISLDFYIRKIITVNAKQLDDKSRIINITCTENGKKFFVDSSTLSAFVRYKKSDGYAVLNQVDILEDGTVNLVLSQQMLAVEGRQIVDIMLINKSELEIYTSSISVQDDDNGNVTIIEKQTANVADISVEEILEAITKNGIKVLSTMSFYINTEGVSIEGSEIESSYEYDALIEGLGKMVAVDNRMSTLEQTINENEVQRQINENVRQLAEEERIFNEENRQESETKRVNAETEREKKVQNTIEECIQKTDDNIAEHTNQMNVIIENSEEAVTNANNAASNATQAGEECEKIVEKYETLDFEKIDEILDYKVEITQDEYKALSDEEKNNGKIYFITDVNEGGTASEVFYDNSKSGITSSNVQNAIDDIYEKKLEKNSVVNNLTTTEEGYTLDARQGKVLGDKITELNGNFVDQTAGGLLRLELYDVPMVRSGTGSIAACIQLPFLAKNIDYEVTINYLTIVNIGTNLPASYGRKTKNAFSIYYALEGSDFNSSYSAQRIDVTINFK